MSEVLNGKRLPRLPRACFVEAYVRACLTARRCNAQDIEETVTLWINAWHLLASAEKSSTAGTVGTARHGPCLLPQDPALFVGRAADVTHASNYIFNRESRTPTVLITGAGGIGKTSLAVRIAHLVAPDFPDGQLYVDLDGTRADPANPSTALKTFLTALGGIGSAGHETFTERLHAYRMQTAHRRILVVLDNAANAAQIRDLLPSGTGCAVIATSRTTMPGLHGMRMPISELTPGQATELLAGMIGTSRLHAEPQAAHQIVQHCAGLPLAIWIAGARLAARPHQRLTSMATALNDPWSRLDELAMDDVSVRASVRLSYDAVTATARHALRLLSLVETTPFTSATAAYFLDASITDTNRVMDELIDASLLNVTPHPVHNEYRVNDLVRLFAGECACIEDSPPARTGARQQIATMARTPVEQSTPGRETGWPVAV